MLGIWFANYRMIVRLCDCICITAPSSSRPSAFDIVSFHQELCSGIRLVVFWNRTLTGSCRIGNSRRKYSLPQAKSSSPKQTMEPKSFDKLWRLQRTARNLVLCAFASIDWGTVSRTLSNSPETGTSGEHVAMIVQKRYWGKAILRHVQRMEHPAE